MEKKPRSFRFSDETLKKMKAQARLAGFDSIAEWMREQAKTPEEKQQASDDLRRANNEIVKIMNKQGISFAEAQVIWFNRNMRIIRRQTAKLTKLIRFQAEEAPFQCPYCHVEPFDTKDKLSQHIREQHKIAKETKKYRCPFCDIAPFSSKSKLDKHVRTKHPSFWNAYRNGWKVAT